MKNNDNKSTDIYSKVTPEEESVVKTARGTPETERFFPTFPIGDFFLCTVNLQPRNSVDKGDLLAVEVAWGDIKVFPPMLEEFILLFWVSNNVEGRKLCCSKLFPIELLIFPHLRKPLKKSKISYPFLLYFNTNIFQIIQN